MAKYLVDGTNSYFYTVKKASDPTYPEYTAISKTQQIAINNDTGVSTVYNVKSKHTFVPAPGSGFEPVTIEQFSNLTVAPTSQISFSNFQLSSPTIAPLQTANYITVDYAVTPAAPATINFTGTVTLINPDGVTVATTPVTFTEGPVGTLTSSNFDAPNIYDLGGPDLYGNIVVDIQGAITNTSIFNEDQYIFTDVFGPANPPPTVDIIDVTINYFGYIYIEFGVDSGGFFDPETELEGFAVVRTNTLGDDCVTEVQIYWDTFLEKFVGYIYPYELGASNPYEYGDIYVTPRVKTVDESLTTDGTEVLAGNDYLFNPCI